MQNTINFYQNEFEKNFADIPAAEFRQQALEAFVQLGWPTAKMEAWKYTRPRLLQEKEFALDKTSAFKFSDERYVKSMIANFPSMVMDPGHPWPGRRNAFKFLNDALWTESFLIYIPKNTKLPEKLHIQIQPPAAQHSRFLKLFIQLDEGAEADILLENLSASESFINLVIETNLHEKAKLSFAHLCQDQAIHYVMHNVYQATHSHFSACDLSLQAQWFRQDLNVYLQAEYAGCELKGLYLGKDKQHVDHHLCVYHEAAHCKSNQFFKGVVTDQAKAVFNGKVAVAKDAQKTDATQKNNNMLLSATAEVYTKPELEIYANDVICAHGATVGELSEEAMFYLESRGINKLIAKKMLLSAFAKEIVPEFARTMVEGQLEGF